MTSIGAVKVALERGKKEDALYLLRKLLAEKPSAEAHYIAAKLAPNTLMAKKHLVNALHYDAKYEPALLMLMVIQKEELSRTGQLRNEMMDDMSLEQELANDDTHPSIDFLRIKNWMQANQR